ncbi:hypothetical protein EVG20_g10215 [Dentipellis fragilis]|uniref:OTU domain-containing protein n=1 Tax=Dentipellis fragilis TaxID=205917 RepID=A0A4Y9XUX1_9AGAM|nr:hypothetical protein EVG20_g10215 [Dentipellis fragilis]
MGTSKRHQRGLKAPPQMRRTTRSSKGRLLTDPTENTQQLTSQLRQLGLYAANTLGDGNCLFRALSDQLHGSDSYHLQLRRDICDWIEKHKARYEPPPPPPPPAPAPAPAPVPAAPSSKLSGRPDFEAARVTIKAKPGLDKYDALLPPNYTQLLPKTVREAFEAPKFEWGNIPEWVPPVEMR